MALETGEISKNNGRFLPPAYTQRTEAHIITTTPMRVTLGGGGTDVPWYACLQGGAWISAAFDRKLHVCLMQMEAPHMVNVLYGAEATLTDDYRTIQNRIIRACLEHTGVVKGISVAIQSNVSGRSGLGGSAALEVGILNALHTYRGEQVSQLQLAQEAFHIEGVLLGEPIGPQDQYAVALGGIKYYEVDRVGAVGIERLPLSPHALSRLRSNLLYFRTGKTRSASRALGDQRAKSESRPGGDPEQIRALDTIKQIGQDVKRWLARGRDVDLREFGKSLDTHWAVKRGLSTYVSDEQIDTWYAEALRVGALGGKIMGAGGGGWFMFYVEEDRQDQFRERMTSLGLQEQLVGFDMQGTRVSESH